MIGGAGTRLRIDVEILHTPHETETVNRRPRLNSVPDTHSESIENDQKSALLLDSLQFAMAVHAGIHPIKSATSSPISSGSLSYDYLGAGVNFLDT